MHLALGGIPRHAFGRVTREAASHAADVFRVDTRGLLLRPDRRTEVLLMGRNAQAQLTGAGLVICGLGRWRAVSMDDRDGGAVILPLSAFVGPSPFESRRFARRGVRSRPCACA